MLALMCSAVPSHLQRLHAPMATCTAFCVHVLRVACDETSAHKHSRLPNRLSSHSAQPRARSRACESKPDLFCMREGGDVRGGCAAPQVDGGERS